MPNKKNILFITFFYRPYNTVGSLRTSGLVDFLRSKGYNVYVITSKRNIQNSFSTIDENENTFYIDWPNADKLMLNHKLMSFSFLKFIVKALNRLSVFSSVDLPEGGILIWRLFALIKSNKLLKSKKIDVIYTSSGPVSTAILGSKLSKKYNVPWFVEFRDLWTDNIYLERSRIRKFYNAFIERRILKNANQIVTVNKALANELKFKFGKPTTIVYNGFDKIDYSPVSSKKLTIIYTGTLIKEKRDPGILLKAIRELYDEGKLNKDSLELSYYGGDAILMQDIVESYQINEFVKIYGIVSKSEANAAIRNSHIQLLLSWNNIKDQATPAKLFEYIGFKKPILAICYPGEIKEILDEAKCGVVITEIDLMKEFILSCIKLLNEGRIDFGFEFSQSSLKKYSREYQFSRLIPLIDESN